MAYYIKQGQSSIFKAIKLHENECEILKNINNIKTNKIEKIVKKMKNKNINQVVLSRDLKQNKEFINILNNYDITIFDGKWFMQYILQDIINFLMEKKELLDNDEITFLANDLTTELNYNIRKFSDTYKKIRIVTNRSEKFKKLEEDLYEKNGITVIITNNKRKALAKSKLIINFDFVQETINEYNINENAIIINLNDRIKINKKRFCGVILTDYEVKFTDSEIEYQSDFFNVENVLEKQKDFNLKEIIEEIVYYNTSKQSEYERLQTIENIIKQYGIRIKELYGLNSIIN